MAKKQGIAVPKIRCSDCKKAVGEVNNYLIGCSDKNANPGGFKMGTYPRWCEYFIKK